MSVTVRAPNGRVWKVRRTLAWPRWRKTGIDLSDGLGLLDPSLLAGENPIAALIVLIAVALLLGIFLVVFLPLLLFLVELILLVPAVLLVFRPWRVIASTAGPPPERLEWRVRGWRGSRAAVEEVARELGHGVHAAPENAE